MKKKIVKKVKKQTIFKHPRDAGKMANVYNDQRAKRAKIFVRAKYTGNEKVAGQMRKSLWDETKYHRGLGNVVGKYKKAMKVAGKMK